MWASPRDGGTSTFMRALSLPTSSRPSYPPAPEREMPTPVPAVRAVFPLAVRPAGADDGGRSPPARRPLMRVARLLPAAVLLLAGPALADNWPAWRGPIGQGRAPDRNPPL